MTDSREIDWSSGDVMITDPPYDRRIYKRATSHGQGKGRKHRDLGHEPLTGDLLTWTCELAAKIPRWSVIFSDVESVGAWRDGLELAGATYVRAMPWIRWSMPQLSGDRPPQGCEMIVLAWGSKKGRKAWNGPGNLTHFDETKIRRVGKHMCEKPLALMHRLVEYFSDPGETVIDPFCGAGTTALAARLLGRQAKFNEIDPHWMAYAQRRFDAETLTHSDEMQMLAVALRKVSNELAAFKKAKGK